MIGLTACAVVVGGLLVLPAPQAVPGDTVKMHVNWNTLDGKHSVGDSIGELSGIALDSSGFLYASDFSAGKIWVFDFQGQSLAAVGRKGQGPGEFDAPTGLGVGPDSRLYVRDVIRVTTFSKDVKTGILRNYETSFRGPMYADWRSMRATRFDTLGRMFYPSFNSPGLGGVVGYYFGYSPDGVLVDSLGVPRLPNAPPPVARVMTSPNSGRMLSGLNYTPFAAIPVWDVTPHGTIVIGSAQSYVLKEISRTGQTLRTYSRQVPAQTIPSGQRRDSIAALRARLDSVPVSLDRVEGMPAAVRNLDLPKSFPAYMAVYTTHDGLLWVRRWTSGPSQGTIFDVFAANGEFLTTVTLPVTIASFPTPALSLAAIGAVVVDPETGANGVVLLSAR